MSYQMSPPTNAAPRPYSPYQQPGASPTNLAPAPFGPPPAKRQRMSPDPRSPQNGPPTYAPQHHGLPNVSSYGNPYAPPAAQSPYGPPGGYANSPQSSFNTPQPYPYQHMTWQPQPPTPVSAGSQYGMPQSSPPQQRPSDAMPPPPRPNKEDREEKAGHEELGDSLFGSGINLKEEENYLQNIYNNRHTQGDSFSTNQNTSFGSSTMSPGNSFNMLTQGTSLGSQDANGAFAGTMGTTLSQDAIELEQRRKRDKAAKELAESRQHHLNNQFLLCNNVRKRMDRLALDQGVTINMQGVFLRQPETQTMVNGEGKEGIAAALDKVNGVQRDDRPESVVNQSAQFEHVVTLVSLAAGERLRGLLDDAYSLARTRSYGDHGRVVPIDFADIAEGEGKRTEETVAPQNLTGSQWDKLPTPASNAGVPNSATPQPQRTVSFQGNLNAQLRAIAERDKAAEQARAKKREARKRAAEAAANGETLATPTTPADAAAPTLNGTPAESAAPLKMTKKEAAKQAKEKNSSTEAQMHSTTNQTAAMMALGKKGSRYKWMTGGAASMPTNRFAKPGQGGSGTATPARVGGDGAGSGGPTTPGAVATAMVRTASAEVNKAPEWGDWREDAAPGVEMRDWVAVLERDGRDKKARELALWGLK